MKETEQSGVYVYSLHIITCNDGKKKSNNNNLYPDYINNNIYTFYLQFNLILFHFYYMHESKDLCIFRVMYVCYLKIKVVLIRQTEAKTTEILKLF